MTGHLAPAASPRLLRERIGRAIEGLRFTPSLLLEELLRDAVEAGVGVMLDLKAPVEPALLADVARRAGLAPGRVYVSTRWHSLSPGLAAAGFRVLLSVDSRPLEPALLVRRASAVGLATRYSYVDPGLVGELRSAGLVVVAWTVNARDELCRLSDLGVDIVVTDAPCRARRWLRSC